MARTDSGHSNCLHQGQASACFDFPSSSSVLLVMDDQTSLVAPRYFRQGEAVVSTARIYEWNGTSTSWLGPVSSIRDPYNPNASNPTASNFIDALDIDGNSLIVACHLFPRVDYTVIIYEEDSWPLVFRTVLDENETGFVDVSISNSGIAAPSLNPNDLDGTCMMFESFDAQCAHRQAGRRRNLRKSCSPCRP